MNDRQILFHSFSYKSSKEQEVTEISGNEKRSFSFFNKVVCLVPSSIIDKTRWSTDGQTLVGSFGRGDALNQLQQPSGLDIDDDGSFFIADTDNHRIVRWRTNAKQGEIVAGGKGSGDRTDQLNRPVAVLIDRINDCLIISDAGNRRVMRWSLQKNKQNGGTGEVIISNTYSLGLAMDDEGSIYVSDVEKHEVRRYGRWDGRAGVVVASGHGQGTAVNQLDRPQAIVVSADQSVYVSDTWNHRVMKWTKGAKKGVVVAGGHDVGDSLTQLSWPTGIFVDQMGSMYVADQGNDRVMRWLKGAKEGEVLAGGNGDGSEKNQLYEPESISIDDRGNLYVADRTNHRIQRFDLR